MEYASHKVRIHHPYFSLWDDKVKAFLAKATTAAAKEVRTLRAKAMRIRLMTPGRIFEDESWAVLFQTFGARDSESDTAQLESLPR